MITFRKLGHLGRFGNQLFQYTGTRLYAEKHAYKLAIPEWIGCEIFKDVQPWSFTDSISSFFLPTVQLSDIASYDKLQKIRYLLGLQKSLPKTARINDLYLHPRDNISIYGYMQDEFSLSNLSVNRTKVRSWLEFKPEIEIAFKEYRPERKYIAIHIRRSDFVKRGLAMPIENYRQWLSEYYNETPIYISSDDPAVAKQFSDYEIIQPPKNNRGLFEFVFDFWMLKNSSVLLGCGSTFSWWSAFLGGQEFHSPRLTHQWTKDYKPKLEKQIL